MKTDNQITELEKTVRNLYAANKPGRAKWAEWLSQHHVFVVADYANELANRYGANADLARAAAMLHDIADIETERKDPLHEQKSLTIARNLLSEHGYNDAEIALVVDDAIRFHSCHGEEQPSSLEGKILSTADSLAHLKTDFYIYAAWAFGTQKSLDEVKSWTLEKIERDLNRKIFFDEVREEARPDYELIKALFSR